MAILAFFISHTLKVILGCISFWTKESKGYHDFTIVLILFFAGFNIPLFLLPDWLYHLATWLPFAYFIYYPVLALQGSLDTFGLLRVVCIQGVWILVLLIAYKLTIENGLKRFSAVGQ